MVAAFAGDIPRLFGVYRLFDVGRFPGRALHLRTLSLSDVLAAHLGSCGPVVVGSFVARIVAVVDAEHHPTDNAGIPDLVGTGRISIHLLLLSRSVL